MIGPRAGAAPAALLLLLGAGTAPCGAAANDFPTAARADYVLGCMAANGNTRLALERCACSIDAIAELRRRLYSGETQNVRALRNKRKDLARILTVLSEQLAKENI